MSSARHQRKCSDLAQLLREKAPPHPACFRSQEDWVRYLHEAEASGEVRVLLYAGRTGPGEANRGRIKTDKINPQIDFCKDCTHDRRVAMQQANRCKPPAWATVPKAPSKPKPHKAFKPKGAKSKHAVPIVAFNTSTWAVRVFADTAAAARAGFKADQVLLAIATGKDYKGHLWKSGEDFRRKPVALPAAANALDAFVRLSLGSQQLSLELTS
jgi:hypothetical protein